MKLDRWMNMTTLQSPTAKRPEASVRSPILCPSAQCSDPDRLEGRQFRRRARWTEPIHVGGRAMCVCVCLCVCVYRYIREREVEI